jgi:hypothetical protein
MTNKEGVLEVIAAALEAAPSPTLPRKRGRERSGASGVGGTNIARGETQ